MVTADYNGGIMIWSVTVPYLTLLQNFPTTTSRIITNQKLIFIWNNGQKIFVGISTGYVYVYERNSD